MIISSLTLALTLIGALGLAAGANAGKTTDTTYREYTDLEVFLTALSNGYPVASPSQRD